MGYNINTGQITPLMLGVAIAAWVALERGPQQWPRTAGFGLAFALSAKIFNLVALIELATHGRGSLRRLAKIGIAVGIAFAALSLPALAGFGFDLGALARAYAETAGSQGGQLAGGSYGLTSLVEPWTVAWVSRGGGPRWLGSLLAFVICLVPFLAALSVTARRLGEADAAKDEDHAFARFSVALGLAATIHPLLFSYAFAWVYPMLAVAYARGARAEKRARGLQFAALALATFGLTVADRVPILAQVFSGWPLRSLSVWAIWAILIGAVPGSGARVGVRSGGWR